MNEPTKTQLTQRVEELRQELVELHQQARYDKLTGLANRRGFEDVECDGGTYLAIDLDGFKKAQDRHPLHHEFGDLVLRSFAEFLKANTRDSDHVACRWGGDEFLVWCPTLVGAFRLRGVIGDWAYCGVTASTGLGSTAESADIAMYGSKGSRSILSRIAGLFQRLTKSGGDL